MDRPHRPFETLETGSELSQRFFAVLRIDDEMTGLRLAPLRGGWAGPSQDRQKDRPKTHRSPLSRAKQEPLVSQPPSLAAGTRSTQLSWFRENYRDRRPPPRARRGATPACPLGKAPLRAMGCRYG